MFSDIIYIKIHIIHVAYANCETDSRIQILSKTILFTINSDPKN